MTVEDLEVCEDGMLIQWLCFWTLSTVLWLCQMLHRKQIRTVEVRIKEHKYNLKRLVQHAYEKGHKICWREAKVLQIEPNTTYRECKEPAHVSLVDRPIS
jgi:hypothetical protein